MTACRPLPSASSPTSRDLHQGGEGGSRHLSPRTKRGAGVDGGGKRPSSLHPLARGSPLRHLPSSLLFLSTPLRPRRRSAPPRHVRAWVRGVGQSVGRSIGRDGPAFSLFPGVGRMYHRVGGRTDSDTAPHPASQHTTHSNRWEAGGGAASVVAMGGGCKGTAADPWGPSPVCGSGSNGGGGQSV